MPVKTQERVGKRVSESGLLNSAVLLSATDRRRLCTIRGKKGRKENLRNHFKYLRAMKKRNQTLFCIHVLHFHVIFFYFFYFTEQLEKKYIFRKYISRN